MAVIGRNLIAFAMGQGDDRVVIDLASASATMADIRNARATGVELPAGNALDRAGRPTTVAADVAALLPRDGNVGSLLGLIVELLAGVAGLARLGGGALAAALAGARAGRRGRRTGRLDEPRSGQLADASRRGLVRRGRGDADRPQSRG
ncbi:Ldh family oxidoreductase [Chelatococcus asaccharovorans]|nr:Ldh family oxidoreductase [Chelatococcus asaccharovorans]